MPKDQLVIEFWNRKNTDRLVGTAYLRMDERLEYMVEVPVEDSYGRVQAYVSLCVGRGDISAATQFLNTHARMLGAGGSQHRK